MQDITDDLYNQFVSTVAEGRGLAVERVTELATGQLYTGTQALDLGLIYELGGLDIAIDIASLAIWLSSYPAILLSGYSGQPCSGTQIPCPESWIPCPESQTPCPEPMIYL